MARIRTIKPDFFRHEGLQDLEAAKPGLYVMLVFAGLWGHCDKAGRFEWKPRMLKLDLLPFLTFDMTSTLEALEGAGLIASYQVGDKRYGAVLNFGKHQRINGKEAQEPEKYPAPHWEQPEEETVKKARSKREAIGKHLPAQEGKGREGNKEGEGEIGREEEKPLVELALDLSPSNPEPDQVQQIFAYWQQRMSSPASKLDDKRRKLIEKALKLYTAHDIGKAIRGCSITPHNMGENDRNTKYNGLNLILRDAEHIDYFIGCNDGAPKKGGKESIEEMNARLEREFLQDGADDANTIEMEV